MGGNEFRHRTVACSSRVAVVLVRSCVVALLGLAGVPLPAQSRQAVAVQASGVATLITANGTRALGFGFEPQLRLNRLGNVGRTGVLSFGAGAQYARHLFSDGSLTVAGAFVEPRLAYASARGRTFRYLALRGALLRQHNDVSTSSAGYALGGGGGVIRQLGYRSNLDVGMTVLYQNFDNATTPAGQLFRFGGTVSFVARLGFNVGLGS